MRHEIFFRHTLVMPFVKYYALLGLYVLQICI